MKKLGLLLLVLPLLTAPATASITDVDIVNVYPDSENLFRDTTVIARLASDSTTSTDVELHVTKPDGTDFKADETKTISVKNNLVREVPFTVKDEKLDQFGEYMFLINESDAGLNGTFIIEIVPQPDVELDIRQDITIGFREFLTVNVNPRTGGPIGFDHIQNPTLRVFKVDDDPATINVEKQLVLTSAMAEDTTTDDLEKNLDIRNLSLGQYEINLKFNISSCTSCENYSETESDVFVIQTNAMTNTAAIIGLGVLPFLVVLIINQFKNAGTMEEQTLSVLAVLFIIGLEYTGYGIATTNNLSKAADAYLVSLLVTVLAFLAITTQLVNQWRKQNKEETLGGFKLNR